jgi:hypothetical protein
VLGGPDDYTKDRGGHPHMISQHLNRHLTDEQRKAWMSLLLQTADDVGLPSDPEFRSALVAYLEWGTRRAVRFRRGMDHRADHRRRRRCDAHESRGATRLSAAVARQVNAAQSNPPTALADSRPSTALC